MNNLSIDNRQFVHSIVSMQYSHKIIDKTNAVAELVGTGFYNLSFSSDAENELQKHIKSHLERLSPRNIMNTVEASDYLRISTRKMRDLQLRGEVKHTLVGSRIIFRRDDLDRYAEKNSVYN